MGRRLIYDCETGGLDENRHSLLTAYFRVIDGNFQTIDSLSLKIKPTDGIYRVTKRAIQVNKINLVSHDLDAVTPELGCSKLMQFLAKHSKSGEEKLTPVGHNIAFDDKFIQKQLLDKNSMKLSGQEVWEIYTTYHRIDTATLQQILADKGHLPPLANTSLKNLAQFFGIDTQGAHDAEIDVDITTQVLKVMLNYVVEPKSI